MSSIVDGQIIFNELNRNAKGGTELMRDRLLSGVDPSLLKGVSINFSRVQKLYKDKINILYAHDLPDDTMYKTVMQDIYRQHIDMFVFVSYHQRDLFIREYKIPFSKCAVIPNAIGDYYHPHAEHNDTINFIYHTTPHRGLEILYPVFDALSKEYNVHLDVYSSFKVYGWESNDKPYQELFEKLSEHKSITYHGAVDNSEIISALRKSHIFLYPCIWHETSCLALMEAIQNGCICIHSDYGALPETARGLTYMFGMHENNDILGQRAYNLSKYILDNYDSVKSNLSDKMMNYVPYSLKDYAFTWDNILKELHYGKRNTIS